MEKLQWSQGIGLLYGPNGFSSRKVFGLYGVAAPQSLASTDPKAKVASLFATLRSIQSRCIAAFSCSRPCGPRGLAHHEPYAFRAKLHRSIRLRPTPRLSWSRWLLALGFYGPGSTKASASADPTALVVSLVVSLRSLRP